MHSIYAFGQHILGYASINSRGPPAPPVIAGSCVNTSPLVVGSIETARSVVGRPAAVRAASMVVVDCVCCVRENTQKVSEHSPARADRYLQQVVSVSKIKISVQSNSKRVYTQNQNKCTSKF